MGGYSTSSSAVTVTADTEFSAAAALADNTANPTTTLVGAMVMAYDGTTWDRVRGTAEGGLNVQGPQAHDAALVTTTQPLIAGGRAADPTSLPTAVAAGDASYVGTSLQQEVLVYLSRLISGEDQTNNSLITVAKPIATSTYAFTQYQNLGAAVSAAIKTSSGNVFSISCHNENASDRYFQLHDSISAPAAAAVPKHSFLVSTNNQIIIGVDFFGQQGLHFSTGIAFGFSTTKDTYTAGAAGDHSSFVNYV